jgi:hypothetical protein
LLLPNLWELYCPVITDALIGQQMNKEFKLTEIKKFGLLLKFQATLQQLNIAQEAVVYTVKSAELILNAYLTERRQMVQFVRYQL